MRANEKRVISDNYPQLAQSSLVGMENINKKVQFLFEKFLCEGWLAKIFDTVLAGFNSLSIRNADLGLPMPADPQYISYIDSIKSLAPVTNTAMDFNLFAVLQDDVLSSLLSNRAQAVPLPFNVIYGKIHDTFSAYKGIFKKLSERLCAGGMSPRGGRCSVTEDHRFIIEEGCRAKDSLVNVLFQLVDQLTTLSLASKENYSEVCTLYMDALTQADEKVSFFGTGGAAAQFAWGKFQGETNAVQASIIKLGRFTSLIGNLESFLDAKIEEPAVVFHDTAVDFISDLAGTQPSPLLNIGYHLTAQTATRGAYSWLRVEPGAEFFPEKILEMWSQDVLMQIPAIVGTFQVGTEVDFCGEECKPRRLQYLRDMESHLQGNPTLHIQN